MLTKLLSVFLAVIAFFTNTFAVSKVKSPLEGGERVQYGEKYNQQYDIYIPENASGEIDVVLMVHGGAWVFGDQYEFSEYCAQASEEYGYAAVTMDYRKLTNGATAYDMVDDIYTVVKSVKEKLSEKGLTPDKMAIAGHSAGAHISLMYAYTHYTDSPIEIGFVVDNCGPTKFFNLDSDGSTTMEKYAHLVTSCMTGKAITDFNHEKMADVISSVSPIDMVKSEVPPTLIVQGAKDSMVPYENSVLLYNKLRENGVYTKFITYENSDHFLKEDAEAMAPVRAEAFLEFAAMYF